MNSVVLIRIFDIIFSLILILFFSPLFIIISLILIIDNTGPLFYVQKRVTKDQKLFRFIKFRSMKNSYNSNSGDHEEYLSMGLDKLKSIRNQYKTTKYNDSRVTSFGKILRKTSLDEIPQFYCVLIGNMSLVGPRPDPPIQRADYEPEIWISRCKVKSGITGLSQINGRSSSSLDQRIKNDIYWAENKSIFLYIKILLKTPFRLFKGLN